MSNLNQKNQAKAIQKRLMELGFDVKLGQAYQVIAAIHGDSSWNVTARNGSSSENKISLDSVGSLTFDVNLKTKVEADCTLSVRADSAKEAYSFVDEFKETQKGITLLSDLSNWAISFKEKLIPTNITEFKGDTFHVCDADGIKVDDFLAEIVNSEIIPVIINKVSTEKEVSLEDLSEYIMGKYDLSEDEAPSLVFDLAYKHRKLKAVERGEGNFFFSLGRMSDVDIAALGSGYGIL